MIQFSIGCWSLLIDRQSYYVKWALCDKVTNLFSQFVLFLFL